MARLTKIHVNLISNALRKRSAKVPYNPNWQKIFSELEVGSLDESARSLLFSKAQLHQLNEMSVAYFGGELLTTSFEGTRAEVAQHSRFEKLATIENLKHAIILGCYGSGKTLLLQFLLKCIAM